MKNFDKEKWKLIDKNNKMVYFNSTKKQALYFQDFQKKYPFTTNLIGLTLLKKLIKQIDLCLQINNHLLQKNYNPLNQRKTIKEGKQIYTQKKSFKQFGVTWSQQEYSHLGFQQSYIKIKSYQRFTEIYSLLQRCYYLGLFKQSLDKNQKKTIRFASLGGGPGFELLAVKYFFHYYFPLWEVQLVSLDIQPSWKYYVDALGFQFIQYDVYDDNLLEKTQWDKEPIETFILVSHLFIYCNNDFVAYSLSQWLNKKIVTAILVNERTVQSKIARIIDKYQIKTTKILPLSYGQNEKSNGQSDERQIIFSSLQYPINLRLANKTPLKMTFPNVPFDKDAK